MDMNQAIRSSSFLNAPIDGEALTRMSSSQSETQWQDKWGQDEFAAPWMGRGLSPEISAAVRTGWFPCNTSSLDIGCGEGDVAAWMATRGFSSVGIDIAPAAITRAKSRYFGVNGTLDFYAMNLCHEALRSRKFKVLIDRGCFHTIPVADQPRFVQNILSMCDSSTRVLFFCRAYRHGIQMGDATERRRVATMIKNAWMEDFRVINVRDTYLDPFRGRNPEKAMGGIVCWMERRQ